MVQKVKNILLYAGVDRLSFNEVAAKINETNRNMVTAASSIAVILLSVMFYASFQSLGFDQNRVVYGFGLVTSIVTLILSVTLAKKYEIIATALVHVAYAIYYLYGIMIGIVTDPDGKTVTFIALLVFMPIIFICRPICVLGITSFYVTYFVILCIRFKSGNVMSVDIVDAIIFGILGTACSIVVNSIKVRGYVSERMIQEIGRIDQLTQLRNRNAFEFERFSIPDKCRNSIACLYIDANGLHEINNEKGHPAGDAMLKFVAEQIKTFFGDEYSYRIGGDEFVSFIIDPDANIFWNNINNMVDGIESEGYHIAFGVEISKVYKISLDEVIRQSEKRMEAHKAQYYQSINRKIRNSNNRQS